MHAAVYLLLGLAIIGALVYALMQVNARQQRLHAELTRLERLAAEVTMNAEAVLDQVDQRIERLAQLAASMEARVESAPSEPPPAPAPPKQTGRRKGGSKPEGRKGPQAATAVPEVAAAVQPEPAAAPVAPAEQPAKPPRYSDLRQAVFALADQGKSPLEIAEALSVPRGEIQLILNLRGRKVSPS
ncbi:MAG: hypothetical protein ACOY93_01755 [Bacillota bacterium]